MASLFWHLDSPPSPQKLAEWDPGKVDSETVICPINDGHQHTGKRLTNLSVILPNGPVEDFVWTWYSQCLMQDRTLQLLRAFNFTGFEVKPVTARFKRSTAEQPPTLWELILTGWAGMANPASGLRFDEAKSCAICGHLTYTGLLHPEQLIDEKAWDGSDFFMVWPFPRFVFVTERVVSMIGEHDLTGVQIACGSNFKSVTDEFSPGRLSYLMPEKRARELGEPLGIY